jgi:hypothetical protein
MKKILEVLEYGDMDIRFNTDIDPVNNPEIILDTITKVTFSMMTKLWGGNEQAVLAMIRALAIADLSLSVNRKEMIRYLDDSSRMIVKSLAEARKEFEKRGGKIMTFVPEVMPDKMKS